MNGDPERWSSDKIIRYIQQCSSYCIIVESSMVLLTSAISLSDLPLVMWTRYSVETKYTVQIWVLGLSCAARNLSDGDFATQRQVLA
jgi:hypothetical protein